MSGKALPPVLRPIRTIRNRWLHHSAHLFLERCLACVLRLLQPHQQPLFGALGSEMEQARGLVFGQVVQACFDDVLGVLAHGEGDTLRLLVHRALDDLVLLVAVSV